MSKDLLILGAGQYGHVVKEIAEAMGCYHHIQFLDDNNPVAIGKLADYERFASEYGYAFVAMGKPKLRRDWMEKLKQAGFELPVLIHPRGHVSPTATLGEGTIVEAMAFVNAGAIVETGGLLCAGCVVNHNAHVKPYCQIDCNAVVAANAIVPEGTKVTSGTVYERK